MFGRLPARFRSCLAIHVGIPAPHDLSLSVRHSSWASQVQSNGATIVDGGMVVQDNQNGANTITVVNSHGAFSHSVISGAWRQHPSPPESHSRWPPHALISRCMSPC